jgi:hypothetical protein
MLVNLPGTMAAVAFGSVGAAFFIMTIQWFGIGSFAALIYQGIRQRK